MLCRYWWRRPEAAEIIEQAVRRVLAQGMRTPDINDSLAGQAVGTPEMTTAILANLGF